MFCGQRGAGEQGLVPIGAAHPPLLALGTLGTHEDPLRSSACRAAWLYSFLEVQEAQRFPWKLSPQSVWALWKA